MVIAVPIFSEYRTRAKISEGVHIVANVLLNVEETYRETGSWPDSNDSAGIAEPAEFATQWVNEIVVEHDNDDKARIRIVYNYATVGGGIQPNDDIIFKPIAVSGRTNWDCTDGAIASYYRPQRCRASS